MLTCKHVGTKESVGLSWRISLCEYEVNMCGLLIAHLESKIISFCRQTLGGHFSLYNDTEACPQE